MKTSYERYLKENEESEISFSSFVKLRPKNILPMDNHKYLQCHCEYCLNVQFKVESLNRFCISKGLDNIACDKYAMSNITLCKNDKNILITCIDRKCSSCGLSRFDRATEVLNTTHLSIGKAGTNPYPLSNRIIDKRAKVYGRSKRRLN